jgi:hypothetical protein
VAGFCSHPDNNEAEDGRTIDDSNGRVREDAQARSLDIYQKDGANLIKSSVLWIQH